MTMFSGRVKWAAPAAATGIVPLTLVANPYRWLFSRSFAPNHRLRIVNTRPGALDAWLCGLVSEGNSADRLPALRDVVRDFFGDRGTTVLLNNEIVHHLFGPFLGCCARLFPQSLGKSVQILSKAGGPLKRILLLAALFASLAPAQSLAFDQNPQGERFRGQDTLGVWHNMFLFTSSTAKSGCRKMPSGSENFQPNTDRQNESCYVLIRFDTDGEPFVLRGGSAVVHIGSDDPSTNVRGTCCRYIDELPTGPTGALTGGPTSFVFSFSGTWDRADADNECHMIGPPGQQYLHPSCMIPRPPSFQTGDAYSGSVSFNLVGTGQPTGVVVNFTLE